jgi:hypothetical protein
MARLFYALGAVALLGAAGVVISFVRQCSCSNEFAVEAPLGIAHRLTQDKRGPSADQQARTSVLVMQAQALASYLSPPAPPPSAKPAPVIRNVPVEVEPPPAPIVESPKFKVFGTSCSELHPERSMVLIAEPGQEGEAHWVKEGTSVGHFVIHEIRDGVVTCLLGEKPYELAVEPQPSTTALASDDSVGPIDKPQRTANSASTKNTPAGPLKRPAGAGGPRVGSARSAAID